MYRSVEQTNTNNNNNIYIFFGFIVVIVFIITAYYIKSAISEKEPPTPEVDCVGDDCTLETDPPPSEVDCVGQWGEWGECSVGCTDDGSGTGIQSRKYSILVNSENNGKECPENEGTTMTRVCNDGLLCHNDCEGSWEITNCQVEGIDVICGPSERTYTFTRTIPPINDGETCLERYGDEIPEYIREQLPDGEMLSGQEVIEQCDDPRASDFPVSYISRSCGSCDETENKILDNKACVPKTCGDLPTNICDPVTQHRKAFGEIGFNAATCCEDKTCGEWGSDNECDAGKTLKLETVIGFTQDDCCRPLTCGDWFDNEGECNLITSTRKSEDVVGNTLEQCCEPKTCREIKQTLGEDTCPGNINTRIYARSDPENTSQKLDKGLNLCFKNLDETIPVNKMGGKQWEEICCGPSKIEIQEVAEKREYYGDHTWTEPAHNTYRFVAGRCDKGDDWNKVNYLNNNKINNCHNKQALDLPNVATECPDDDDVVHEEIYNSVYVDTFIKSESGWEYCTDPNPRDCRNDTPDYSLLNY